MRTANAALLVALLRGMVCCVVAVRGHGERGGGCSRMAAVVSGVL